MFKFCNVECKKEAHECECRQYTQDSKDYFVTIHYSQDEDGYIALAPRLPGCSAFGETMAIAANEIQQAIALWLEAKDLRMECFE